jgi:ABC-2 type transport system permease protein
MNKIWKIITYEYRKHVFQKKFLFSLLSFPIVILALVGMVFLIAFFNADSSPIGYIDHSGVLDDPVSNFQEGNIFEPVVDILSYQSENQAENDLTAGKIQAYFIIPENYPANRDVKLIYLEAPDYSVVTQFQDFVFQNLSMFKDIDPLIAERLSDGINITMSSLDGSLEMGQDQWFLILVPFIAGILFIFVVMTSGGYLLQAVVEEKENRTMEIVISSVSPNQLMTGKIIGNIAVGLTQLGVWLIFGWIGLSITSQYLPILSDFSLQPGYVFMLLLILLPAFVMIASLLAAIGATMTELREAQQFQTLVTLPMMVPFYLATPIMMNPNSPLAIVLSFFPITAPLTILMRMGYTVIPAWQFALSISVLFAFATLAIWFAGRAFRMGMLQYGKKLSLKAIFGKGQSK